MVHNNSNAFVLKAHLSTPVIDPEGDGDWANNALVPEIQAIIRSITSANVCLTELFIYSSCIFNRGESTKK